MTATTTREGGLFEIKIGANVSHKGPGGRTAIALVRRLADFPRAKKTAAARCITCKKEWPSAAALIAAHDVEALVRANVQHVWGWYSAEPARAAEVIPEEATPLERARIEASNAAIPRIGLLSSVEWSTSLRDAPRAPEPPPRVEGGAAIEGF